MAARGLTVAITALTGALGIIFTLVSAAQLIGSFFDIDVLKEIKDFFKDISQAAKEASAGVAGLTAVGGAGSDSLTQVLARLGLDKSTLEEIPDLLEDIEEELNSLRTLGGAQIAVQGVNRGFIEEGLYGPDRKKALDELSSVAQRFLTIQERIRVLQGQHRPTERLRTGDPY